MRAYDRDELIAGLAETPLAMTLSHDRLVLQRADKRGHRVVVVRCPHTIGLAILMPELNDLDYLGLLPCPCNDRTDVLADVVPREGSGQ